MTALDFRGIRNALEPRIQKRLYNHHSWFGGYFEAEEAQETQANNFPYRPAKKACGEFKGKRVVPISQGTTVPNVAASPEQEPVYLVNMPFVPPMAEQEPYRRYLELIGMIHREAFSSPGDFSRFALVIGMNRMQSLDSDRNEQFYRYVEQLPANNQFANRVFGRLWEPKWSRVETLDYRTYPVKKAFLLLKSLNLNAARRVVAACEGDRGMNTDMASQIPYQKARQMIKDSPETQMFYSYVRETVSDKPVYLATMDDDTRSLNLQAPLFSVYDDLIRQWLEKLNKLPQLLSTGYWAADTDKVLYQIGIILDMIARQAMARVIPNAPYYPEPNLILLLQGALSRYSFLGDGNGLEGRRLVVNGIASGVLDPSRFGFYVSQSLVTTIPNRMKSVTRDRISRVTPENVGQKALLRALRGISQSHIFAKNWADNLYIALPIKAKVTSVTKHLMAIFNVFDPISVAEAFKPVGSRHSSAQFCEAFKSHSDYHRLMSLLFAGEVTLEHAKSEFARLNPSKAHYADAFEGLYRKCLTARQQLLLVGLDLEWINKVTLCAQETAKDVSEYLIQFMNAAQ